MHAKIFFEGFLFLESVLPRNSIDIDLLKMKLWIDGNWNVSEGCYEFHRPSENRLTYERKQWEPRKHLEANSEPREKSSSIDTTVKKWIKVCYISSKGWHKTVCHLGLLYYPKTFSVGGYYEVSASFPGKEASFPPLSCFLLIPPKRL